MSVTQHLRLEKSVGRPIKWYDAPGGGDGIVGFLFSLNLYFFKSPFLGAFILPFAFPYNTMMMNIFPVSGGDDSQLTKENTTPTVSVLVPTR